MSEPLSTLDEISLADALKFVVDNRGKTVPTAETGIALIATNCISNEDLYPRKENIRYTSQEIFDNWFRSHPIPGDIILTNKGSNNGEICLVPENVDFCIAQDMVAVRADERKIEPLYLFAALRSKLVQKRIKYLNVDAVIPHFKKTEFNKLIIPLPNKDLQKFIGEIYFNLSLKIENLKRQNETLQEIARSIFKHWFIDFEFPNADGKPYKSSGGVMVRSELGDIPEDWHVGKLGEIIINYDRKRIPLSSIERQERQGKYPYYGAASIMDYIDDYIFDGLYILMGEDGTVIDDKGYPILQYISGKFWVNNHAHVIQGKDEYSTNFVYLFLKRTRINNIVTGAVQPKVNQANMNAIKLVIPDSQVLNHFKLIITPIFEKIIVGISQIQTLTKARDTLLPKLMSGQLRVEV